MAADREEIVGALLQGYGSISHGTVPPWHWAFEPGAGVVPYDTSGARALLEEAGWVDRDGDGPGSPSVHLSEVEPGKPSPPAVEHDSAVPA